MTFSWIVKLIIGGGGGLWFGHWSARRFGRWGTAIALAAFMAGLFVGSWAKHLVGSDQQIIAKDSDSPAYGVEMLKLDSSGGYIMRNSSDGVVYGVMPTTGK